MKKFILAASMLGLLFLGGTANAQMSDEQVDMIMQTMADQMMETTDANGDRIISKDEFFAQGEKQFKEMDANGDKKLEVDEIIKFQKQKFNEEIAKQNIPAIPADKQMTPIPEE